MYNSIMHNDVLLFIVIIVVCDCVCLLLYFLFWQWQGVKYREIVLKVNNLLN